MIKTTIDFHKFLKSCINNSNEDKQKTQVELKINMIKFQTDFTNFKISEIYVSQLEYICKSKLKNHSDRGYFDIYTELGLFQNCYYDSLTGLFCLIGDRGFITYFYTEENKMSTFQSISIMKQEYLNDTIHTAEEKLKKIERNFNIIYQKYYNT